MVAIQEKNILVSYDGALTFDIIGELIHQLKNVADQRKIPLSTFKRLLSATIESLENVFKYVSTLPADVHLTGNLPLPAFSIEETRDMYILRASNPVMTTDVEEIRHRLDRINSLDRAGLKELYKETITDGIFTARGGAGLGFIEMAKVSNHSLKYQFSDYHEPFTWFNLEVIITNKH